MASKKKSTKKEETSVIEAQEVVETQEPQEIAEPVIEETPKTTKTSKKSKEKTPKYPIGSIVYISKNAEADLNGFNLFPQYKKDTYTVEAYDDNTGVYTLRRLKLLVKLKEDLILAPDEHGHDTINRIQF